MFASLGLAGVMMVAMAAAQMTKFVAGSDRITAALAIQRAPLAVATPADASRTGTTNASRPADAHAATRGFANGKIRSACDSGLSLLLR